MTNARKLLCVLTVEQLTVRIEEREGGGKRREGRRRGRELRREEKRERSQGERGRGWERREGPNAECTVI